jgi:hypothetical protein
MVTGLAVDRLVKIMVPFREYLIGIIFAVGIRVQLLAGTGMTGFTVLGPVPFFVAPYAELVHVLHAPDSLMAVVTLFQPGGVIVFVMADNTFHPGVLVLKVGEPDGRHLGVGLPVSLLKIFFRQVGIDIGKGDFIR